MTATSGSAVAITGAASAIGRALALELAARGCDLALADTDEPGLASAAAGDHADGEAHIIYVSSIFGIIAPEHTRK